MIPVCVLTGPTASGKTALALGIAERFGAQIVSADSMQVYRRLDIGTAKPSAAQRARIRHHLMDVADPDEPFDAVRYRDLADAAIAGIAKSGDRVLVVGGTGLYLRILLYGIADLPPPDPERRAALEAEADRAGAAALHARLATLDPVAAARIHASDRFRIIRALEVIGASGRRLSDLQEAHAFAAPRYRSVVVALHVQRDVLRRRIIDRAHAMLAAGLLGEVRGILDAGYSPSLRPLRAFGYREPVRCVLGRRPAAGLAEAIARDTARYAKRQTTWLRSERDVEWMPPDETAISERFGELWEGGS